MEMNKLDEIIESQETFDKNYPTISIEDAKTIALEFGKHLLEEAAENAKIKGEWKTQGGNPKVLGSYRRVFDGYIVDKQSITDTLNKYL